ncbi:MULTISPECIES: DUF7541 family protein [Salinibaculum]|uniref:DUF7541 family protein n=1 Tax=Salinibaculum TaxID=2732368 RepID=UPI0030D2ECBE
MSDEVGDDVGEVSPGLSEQYRKASPWPMLVAFGFVISEIGVVLGIFPITVGGLLLFGGTVAGILKESAYVSRTWLSLGVIAAILAVLGGLAVGLNIEPSALSVEALLDPARPFVYRGTSILAASVVMLGVAATLWLLGEDLA